MCAASTKAVWSGNLAASAARALARASLLPSLWIGYYIKEIMESTEEICRQAGSLKEASLQACVIVPPTLSSEFEHEDKDKLIAKRRARFNRKCMWS
ncbi:hypothetical protein MTO96_002256 [Rhipicephalus appendiculatus]